jgi:predicted ATP-grasp superfamily ATP-dependent carboligase
VLILDAHQRSALAVVRSLGQADAHVLTADSSAPTLAGSSRFSRESFVYPDPLLTPAAFVESLAQLVRRERIDLVFPMSDVSTMLLVQQRHQFSGAALSCASADSYESLTNKAALVALAARLGVPAPETHVAATAADILHYARHASYPLVLKPARSRYMAGPQVRSTQVRIARSQAQVAELLKQADWLDHIPCLIQRFIPGHGAGVFALGDGEGVIAWFAHRRIREKPPSGGVSVLCESAQIDADMKRYSESLLSSCGWFGPAMVEFRVCADGTPYLMEVNGRFWGSLQLSIDSGVDFPRMLFALLTGQRAPPAREYRACVRLRWLLGDLDNLLLQMRDRGQSAASKLRAIGSFMGSFLDRSCRQEVLRMSDPAPGLQELKKWLKELA